MKIEKNGKIIRFPKCKTISIANKRGQVITFARKHFISSYVALAKDGRLRCIIQLSNFDDQLFVYEDDFENLSIYDIPFLLNIFMDAPRISGYISDKKIEDILDDYNNDYNLIYGNRDNEEKSE